MFFMTMSHPRMPFLDIAVFTIARCLYISHFFGLSGIPPTIVVIFDRWSLEHMLIFEDAGLIAEALAVKTAAAMTAYFILDSICKKGTCHAQRRTSQTCTTARDHHLHFALFNL